MTYGDAEQLRKMIDGHWKLNMDDATCDLWLGYLVEQDADLATAAVARLSKTLRHPPRIADLREILQSSTPKVVKPTCPTCQDDRFVVVSIRKPMKSQWTEERGLTPPEGAVYEEMAPCPDCNAAADGDFIRADGTKARVPDPAAVREMMNG